MIRTILQYFRDRKKGTSKPETADQSVETRLADSDTSEKSGKNLKATKTAAASPAMGAAPGGDSGKKPNKSLKALILASGAVIVCMTGFVLTVTILNHFRDSGEAPGFGAGTAVRFSNLPARPPAAPQQSGLPDQLPGQPQTHGAQEGKEPPPPGQPKSEHGSRHEQPLAEKPAAAPVPPAVQGNIIRKEANTRHVSDYDPFKTEFLKKYKDAEKKEKRARRENINEASLTDLESTIKGTSAKPVAPVQPPLPPSKDLKLTVYGVVISRGDAYAISDKGIIRVGNNLETFTVEKIEFDTVTLKSRENEKDLRNIFVSANKDTQKTTQQPGVYYPPGGPTSR